VTHFCYAAASACASDYRLFAVLPALQRNRVSGRSGAQNRVVRSAYSGRQNDRHKLQSIACGWCRQGGDAESSEGHDAGACPRHAGIAQRIAVGRHRRIESRFSVADGTYYLRGIFWTTKISANWNLDADGQTLPFGGVRGALRGTGECPRRSERPARTAGTLIDDRRPGAGTVVACGHPRIRRSVTRV